jgi:putative ABC transport system permease protein
MSRLAWRNLFHDKVRFSVTLTGIVFAIVLIVVQIGLFLGFTTTTSNNIDHSGVDLWITASGNTYYENGSPISERKLYQVLATPGVAEARKYIVTFAEWKKPDGGKEVAIIVGFDLASGLGGPWNVVAGRLPDLQSADTVILDESYKQKMGIRGIGDSVEIVGRRARVVGFTRGIRSFTTSPYVFTRFKTALDYAGYREDQTTYILVRAAPGVSVDALRRALLANVRDVEVYTRAEFSRKTQFYWMFTTGAGLAILIAAFMGLIVGVVVVAQTLYATTMDHLREFGTLKAMGASNRYIYNVIIRQAVISAVIGYALAMGVAQFLARGGAHGGAVILVPPGLAVAMFFVALAMCIGASLVSINKVTRLDPALVFKG